MNIISKQTIFDYMEIEILGDLERLKLCLENINKFHIRKMLKRKSLIRYKYLMCYPRKNSI